MPLGQRDTMAFPHVAEAAQHWAQISWFCQKGPLAELRLCTSFLQYHWPSSLRALHFPPQPVLGPASKGQTVNASDKVQVRMMSPLPPAILHDPSHPSPSSSIFSHESDPEDHSSVLSTATPPRSPRENSQEAG